MSTPETPTTSARAGLEPGSFRDPESRVFYAGDEVYRALSADGLTDFEALEATGLLDGERIVRTERASDVAALRDLLVHEPAAVLRHERIPFVSYPYEWTFSMLKDAALLQLDLLLAALEHDMVLKDSTPYNVQFKGALPEVRGRGLLRAHARGRALDRLPPVLHALPLSAAAPVGEARAVPPLAARLDRRHQAERDAPADELPRPLPQGRLHQRDPAREARGALRRQAAAGEGRGQARLQEGAVRRERAQDAQARPAARVGPAQGRLDRLRRAQQLHGRRRAAQGRVRARGGHEPRLESRLGHRLQQRPLLADRRRGRAHGRGRRRRPGPGGAALPRPARRGQRPDPHAHDEPRRPVARPRLARPRAQVAARARQARPRAGARPRAPRGHQRQRAREGVHRLARLARHRARDRVPHP